MRIVKGGGAEGRWEWGGLVDAWLCPPCIRLLPCWWQESQERSAHVGGHDECVY